MSAKPLLLSTVLGAALLLPSCGGDGGSGGSTPNAPGTLPTPAPTGTLAVTITDAPFRLQSVLVTFSALGAQRSGQSGFDPLSFAESPSSRTCDLVRLSQGRTEALGGGALPEGHYTTLRVVIAGGSTDDGDTTPLPACAPSIAPPRGAVPLTIESGDVQIGRDFDIRAGATTTIALDLDLGKSLTSAGGGRYVLKPLIRVDSVSGP